VAADCHLAYIVIEDGGVNEPPAFTAYKKSPDGLSLQYKNVNPPLVGVGAVTEDPAFTVFEVGLTDPPIAFHVTVYCTVDDVPLAVIFTELYPDNEYLTVTVDDAPFPNPETDNAPVDEFTEALPAV